MYIYIHCCSNIIVSSFVSLLNMSTYEESTPHTLDEPTDETLDEYMENHVFDLTTPFGKKLQQLVDDAVIDHQLNVLGDDTNGEIANQVRELQTTHKGLVRKRFVNKILHGSEPSLYPSKPVDPEPEPKRRYKPTHIVHVVGPTHQMTHTTPLFRESCISRPSIMDESAAFEPFPQLISEPLEADGELIWWDKPQEISFFDAMVKRFDAVAESVFDLFGPTKHRHITVDETYCPDNQTRYKFKARSPENEED